MPTTIDRVRNFNRGWTEVLRLLDKGLLGTEYTLTEARVLFELAQDSHRERLALKERLGIDASFLTRVLAGLEERGLVKTSPSENDGRALSLQLTNDGRAAFDALDTRSSNQIRVLLEKLTGDQRSTLVESMALISHILDLKGRDLNVNLRELRSGDAGWVVARHGAIYRDEYGWNMEFEALVARIVAEYLTGHNPERESAWIADLDSARAGCIFCCEQDSETARLRILLVEPWARGLGIGTRLVDECIAFAKRAGYSRMTLWTNDVLVSARNIYEAAGFQLVEEDQHHSFGQSLVGQNWELSLGA